MNTPFDPPPQPPEPEQWWLKAACRGKPIEWFFPTGNGINAHKQAEKGIQVCRGCPVVLQCRKDGKRDSGVWGGQLHNVTRAKRVPDPCGTEGAYRRHLRNGEPVCRLCVQANTLARQLRKERSA